MFHPIDSLVLHDLPRDKPLRIRDSGGSYTCVICGAQQDMYAWRVQLPNKVGTACTNCAADAGFTVK